MVHCALTVLMIRQPTTLLCVQDFLQGLQVGQVLQQKTTAVQQVTVLGAGVMTASDSLQRNKKGFV